MDRIQAMTRAGLKAASAAARGELSKTIYGFREDLVFIKAHIEAAVDFPEDDLPELVTPELEGLVDSVLSRMEALYGTADVGRLYREGASVVIAGRPNVGKSSLFNALLRDARVIVTQYAGTTRDVIEDVITVDGIPVRLADMAGLRDTDDEVERIGVERAWTMAGESDLILFVVDTSEALCDADDRIFEEICVLDIPIVMVGNKRDLDCLADLSRYTEGVVERTSVSAFEQTGLVELEQAVARVLKRGGEFVVDQGMITRLHQKDSLRRGIDALLRLKSNISESPEFMSIDMDDALEALGEITGETTPDEVLGQIFESFCIGK
jgi:tRNA modification GTPase